MTKDHLTHNSKALHESTLSWKKVIDKIDHIFINKLALLRSKDNNLNKVIPDLLKGYHLALEHKLLELNPNQALLDELGKDTDLKSQIEPMFQTLDAVHIFCAELLNTQTTNKTLSAKKCVNNILHSYKFNHGEDSIIHFKSNFDFNFSFSAFFINAALLEFIRFTFKIFKESAQKKIEIYFSNQDHTNAIHFKIICPETQTNYNHFFENSLNMMDDKIMPGINFCRLALLNANGDISYKAIEGQEVEFVIYIPN